MCHPATRSVSGYLSMSSMCSNRRMKSGADRVSAVHAPQFGPRRGFYVGVEDVNDCMNSSPSDPTLGRKMNTSSFRAIHAVIFAVAMLVSTQPLSAQQSTAAQLAPAASQPAAVPTQAAPTTLPAVSPSAPTPAVSDASATPSDNSARPLKSTMSVPRELSPWSMFLSADILVKAVMIGLAFASLVTWTIFLAKMIELSLIRRKLRAALGTIADARSLAEAQFALGAKGSVLSSLLAAALREARLSAGVELCRNRPRRGAPDQARHGRARDHRRDVALRRAVRHGVGHHEQLYRHLEIADDEPRRGRAGDRGGAACDGVRSRRGNSGRHHLQPFFAHDEGVPRVGRAGIGRGRAAVVARSRSHPCRLAIAGGGISDGRFIR